jgi:hypothetical protein
VPSQNREDLMRTVLQVIKKTMHGAPSDQLAELEERLHAERMNAAAAAREVEQLEQQRRMADDFDTARGLDDALARARWTIERCEAAIPPLELARDRALADQRRDLLARHKSAIGKIYPRLRDAIDAAAAVQGEAIAALQAAIAELGEGVVQANIPALAFMGLLLPDLIEIWGKEMDRFYAPAQPMPTPARALSPPAQRPPKMAPAVSNHQPPPPNARIRRALRCDSQAGDGERLICLLRSGLDIGGFQTIAGDTIAVPIETAKKLVSSGAADFAGESFGLDAAELQL